VNITSCAYRILELVLQHIAAQSNEAILGNDFDCPAVLDVVSELRSHSALQLLICGGWILSRHDLRYYAGDWLECWLDRLYRQPVPG